jgi:hypothetical protein
LEILNEETSQTVDLWVRLNITLVPAGVPTKRESAYSKRRVSRGHVKAAASPDSEQVEISRRFQHKDQVLLAELVPYPAHQGRVLNRLKSLVFGKFPYRVGAGNLPITLFFTGTATLLVAVVSAERR